MLRVYATIQKSQYESTFSSEMDDLISWTLEIQKAMYEAVVCALSLILNADL